MAFTTLKGKRRIAPITLNTRFNVNPTILKGSRISQIRGNKKRITIASGQHSTNSRHHRIRTSNVRMVNPDANTWPI